VLVVQTLTKDFDGFLAVKNVSFEVAEGEILGLIGPNGSGKSTTFNLIAGSLRPTAGSVRFLDRELAGLPAYRVAHAGIGRTYQIPRPFKKLSVVENVALAAFYGKPEALDRSRAYGLARECLKLVGLPTEESARVEGLGAAGLKKLELARALATQPRLLLADESLNGLDHSEMEQAADMLNRIRRDKGITIVWVEHIMGVLMRVVDRVLVLDHGEVIFAGRPKDAQADARVVEVYLGAEPDA